MTEEEMQGVFLGLNLAGAQDPEHEAQFRSLALRLAELWGFSNYQYERHCYLAGQLGEFLRKL